MTSVPYAVPLVGAGAAGAVCRYLVDAWVTHRTRRPFPYGILWVNISGSLMLGIVTGSEMFRAGPVSLTAVAGTGFCGAYTTFSSYTIESVRLFEQRRYRAALTYLSSSAVAGLAAAAVGLAAVRWL